MLLFPKSQHCRPLTYLRRAEEHLTLVINIADYHYSALLEAGDIVTFIPHSLAFRGVPLGDGKSLQIATFLFSGKKWGHPLRVGLTMPYDSDVRQIGPMSDSNLGFPGVWLGPQWTGDGEPILKPCLRCSQFNNNHPLGRVFYAKIIAR